MRIRPPSRIRPRVLRAAFAAFAVLLVVSGPIARVAHDLLVTHVVCEHGELVELNAGSRASAAVSEQSALGPAAETGDSAQFGPNHDHCAIATIARQAASCSAAQTVSMTCLPSLSSSLAAPEFAVVAAQPILSLAPKTSPPRA